MKIAQRAGKHSNSRLTLSKAMLKPWLKPRLNLLLNPRPLHNLARSPKHTFNHHKPPIRRRPMPKKTAGKQIQLVKPLLMIL